MVLQLMKAIFRFAFVMLAAWSLYHALSRIYAHRRHEVVSVEQLQKKMHDIEQILTGIPVAAMQSAQFRHESVLCGLKLQELQDDYSEHTSRKLWRQLIDLECIITHQQLLSMPPEEPI